MALTTSEKAAQAISRQISRFLGAGIEPGFMVIRYPPGYNFNVQYHMPVYYNPHTFALIDQLCTMTGPCTASMTGASFSAKFAAILNSVGYKTSTADAAAKATAIKAFNTQEKAVVQQFEAAFGRVSKRMINGSCAIPKTKAGYIVAYVGKTYPGTPPDFPFNLASFGADYIQWMSMGEQLKKYSMQEQDALHQVAASTVSTVTPDAQNGGLQTGDSSWTVAYTGLPDNNTILSSLRDTSRQLTVAVEMQSDSANSVSLRVDNRDIGSLPNADLKLTLAPSGNAKGTVITDLWSAAQKVEMEIVYSGITVLRADPVEISPDLKTGWYSRQVLTDIVTKTGKDVTGLQLQGSTFSVSDLFGKGKSFARVRTFVISQEPTVTLRFHGAGIDALSTRFSANQMAELELGELLTFGSSSADYKVLDVQPGTGVVTVTLGPPVPVGTVPNVDQTAHVVGGVVSFPP
ncbi:hypothetical protein [Roseovarius sp. 2305UL8-3]|uniref:hypothetical protein n=1 Tax=Roseovarius conchicola TaxID=3121636 RepID=UPI003527B21C